MKKKCIDDLSYFMPEIKKPTVLESCIQLLDFHKETIEGYELNACNKKLELNITLKTGSDKETKK